MTFFGVCSIFASLDRLLTSLVGAGPSSYSVAEASDFGEWTSLSLSSKILNDINCLFTQALPSFTACPVESQADQKAASPTHAKQTGAGPVPSTTTSFDKADNLHQPLLHGAPRKIYRCIKCCGLCRTGRMYGRMLRLWHSARVMDRDKRLVGRSVHSVAAPHPRRCWPPLEAHWRGCTPPARHPQLRNVTGAQKVQPLMLASVLASNHLSGELRMGTEGVCSQALLASSNHVDSLRAL